jgi:hypothetical protein
VIPAHSCGIDAAVDDDDGSANLSADGRGREHPRSMRKMEFHEAYPLGGAFEASRGPISDLNIHR